MVEEVARNASAVAQNTAAARSQPAMPAHQPVRRQPMRLMCRLSTRSQHVSRTGRVVGSVASSSAGTASTKATEAEKSAALQSPQKARRPPVPLRRKRQNECGSVTTISSHFCIRRDHEASEAATSARDAAASKEAAKYQKRTHHQAPVVPLPRQRRQQFREGGKDV